MNKQDKSSKANLLDEKAGTAADKLEKIRHSFKHIPNEEHAIIECQANHHPVPEEEDCNT